MTRPLDSVSSVAAAYGPRKLYSDYNGPLVRLRRGSDDAESDFGADENGDLDIAAISTWLGGSSGYVVTFYDQSVASLSGVTAGVSVVSSGTLGQTHILIGDGIEAGDPVVSSGILGQTHVLTGDGVEAGDPVVSMASVAEDHGYNDLSAGNPVISRGHLDMSDFLDDYRKIIMQNHDRVFIPAEARRELIVEDYDDEAIPALW